MITRLMVIDPQPRDPREDVLVYQVPEHSRAYEMLVELLDKAGLEWTEIQPRRKVKVKVVEGGYNDAEL